MEALTDEVWRRRWKTKKVLSVAVSEHVKGIWSMDRMSSAISATACRELRAQLLPKGPQRTVRLESWQDQQHSLLLAYHETEELPFAHFLLKILHLPSLECLLSTSLLLLPLFSPLWKGVKEAPYVDSLCSQCFQKTLSTGTNCCDCKLPFILDAVTDSFCL